MPLSSGTRIGPYEIISPLGVGGMGEVYRAIDSHLKRQVAIKVLPQTLATDPNRLARFQREAEVLAALNHPNIAHIHGLEEAGGVRALVMELVEGPTLADVIAQGPIAPDEALAIARQIAEALEAAHELGIIHRDLKPANIKVRADGTVKVLDFGLAKAMEPAGASSANALTSTIAVPATEAGVILGTAAYMSPEQASGRPVDRRTDVWSFGAVLWEMLTGRRLFEAETVTHVLADVLRSPIEFDKLPPDAPRSARDLLRRCLDRDPRNRLRDIGEARIALHNSQHSTREGKGESLSKSSARARHKVPWVVATVATIALCAVAFGWWRSTRPVERSLTRLTVDLGLDADAGPNTTAVLSPDGRRIVFSVRGTNGVPQLATRTLDQSRATPIPGTEAGTDAFFSPDGQWIGFFAGGKLKKAAVEGGATITLCDVGASRGGSWGDDGTIVFVPDLSAGLMRVSSAGGTPRPLMKTGPVDTIRTWPQVLPGATAVLFAEHTNPFSWDDADIGVVSLGNGRLKIVQRGGYSPRYVPSSDGPGHLLYVHERTLFAVHFDPVRLETSGMPVPLLQDVAGDARRGSGHFDVALNGTLVYANGEGGSSSYPIAWMDNSGKTAPLLATPRNYGALRFSPDGTRLAYIAPGSKGPDLWVYDFERDIATQLTFTGPGNVEMAWAPNGKHIVYGSTGAGAAALWWVRSDGSGESLKLLELANTGIGLRPQSFTPDGKRLVFDNNVKSASAVEIWTLPLDLSDPEHPRAGKPEPFLTTAVRQVDAAVSPDGKWIAYSSNESGVDEIFVRSFPGPGGKWRVSTASGKFPTWSRTANELFYLSFADGRIMVANYTIQGDSFRAAKPRVWSNRRVSLPNFIRVLDLHPDGKRFAVFPRSENEEAKGSVHVTFLLNFLDELHRRVP